MIYAAGVAFACCGAIFSRETLYDLAPHELLLRYRDMGAAWLHVVDLDGARDGRLANRGIILELATQSALKLQVGGGVRHVSVVDDLLRHGVDRVMVGSAAVEQPSEVKGWLQRFGAEQVGLACDVLLDAEGVPRLRTRGWTQESTISLWDAVADFASAGCVHVLCTDINRDGALAGPNMDLYREAQRRFPKIEWQASGGVSSAVDLAALAQCGVAAAISGKALLEEKIDLAAISRWLPGHASRQSC